MKHTRNDYVVVVGCVKGKYTSLILSVPGYTLHVLAIICNVLLFSDNLLHYMYLQCINPYSTGIDFSRQNLTSVDFSRQNLTSVEVRF